MTDDPDKYYRCAVCGSVDRDGDHFYVQNYTRTGDQTDRLCVPCAVQRWPVTVDVTLHWGVPDAIRDRLRSYRVLKRLQEWFRLGRPFPVYVYPRREAERLQWQHDLEATGGRSDGLPIEPYGYRGWCSYREIILLWDETETPDSMEWLLYHELGHHATSSASMIDKAMAEENRVEGRTTYDWKDDAAHEADSEERLVNRVATAFMGGREYARPWWRPRVRALLAGEPMPDPYAVPEAPDAAE